MNELQVFTNPEFGQVRTVTIEEEPWFVGKDVAVALGYSNTKDALHRHVDPEDKGGSQITTPSGEQTMTIINESGLYALIFGSKLESAKRFKHWVTHEVLPAIRKTGSYSIIPKARALTTDDYMKAAQLAATCRNERLPYDLNRVELIGRTRYLTLQFSEPISFGAVPFHIEKIKTLLSFMTFRQNVDFDEIALQEKTSFPPLLMDTALVYSKGSSTVTQKKAPNNICFNDLDVTLSSLIELIYCEQKNNPFSFMNFVPEDDKGLGRVTNDMVKGIVTCLECEIARLKKSDDITSAIQDNKNDTYIQEELRLQSLVKELQKVAKDFQKKNGKFSKKTNDMICGRLKYMTIADADKVCLFYVKYQKFIRKLFDKFEIVPTEDDIQNLIIYRNRTTHGTQAVLDEHIVTTALYLTGLIYCMILHSIGIDDKNLEQLCSRHFLWR